MSGLDLLLSQNLFVRMLLLSALVGGVLGMIYDALLLLRTLLGDPTAVHPQKADRTTSPGEVARPLSLLYAMFRIALDGMFALLSAVALILLCYYTNDGQIRAPAIFGLACGFFVYKQTVSRLLLRVAVLLLDRLLLRPAQALASWLAAGVAILYRITVGRWLDRRRAALTARRLEALKRSAEAGFPPHE